ncbi:hypothetical protein GXB85_13505 [Cellulomonas sp. APG4]|uniref:hypothetical protein n=1 Tax=Cellulomonas sp. APG4 TaxID=1538656 RepID=UPI00137A7689|nr:hypothetical protein [Cellulomonas sp. APG4]NCT91958.1 hypothetical protein [Cellulomonas sp. APG4]
MREPDDSNGEADERAILALFWESLNTDGVAAAILMRTSGDILTGHEPDTPK